MIPPSVPDTPPIAQYANGGYEVSIYPDGTKVRRMLRNDAIPVHPEQMDLKITNWCDAGCHWCHEKSTKRGKHGDVGAMIELLSDLPAGVEIAIGGGDPLSHPEFEALVRGLRHNGLIPSVTINGRHLDRHKKRLEKLIGEGLLFGVGVSLFKELPDWDYEHMVVHMIAGVDDPFILDNTPSRKVLVLGYKNFGRGEKFRNKNEGRVRDNIKSWYRQLLWLSREHHLSFDTLAISQMKPERLFISKELYDMRFMGNEGQFSLYVDGVEQTFAVSSYSKERGSWSDIRSMFAAVRSGTLDQSACLPTP